MAKSRRKVQETTPSSGPEAPAPRASAPAGDLLGGGAVSLLGMQDTYGNAFALAALRTGGAGGGRAGNGKPGDGRELESRMEGPPGKLPYQEEMERRFGQDFSWVHAFFGQEAEMDRLGAHAAASGEVVAFRAANPPREEVAHELAHVVQARGGDGGGERR